MGGPITSRKYIWEVRFSHEERREEEEEPGREEGGGRREEGEPGREEGGERREEGGAIVVATSPQAELLASPRLLMTIPALALPRAVGGDPAVGGDLAVGR